MRARGAAALFLRRVFDLAWYLLLAGGVAVIVLLIVGVLRPGRVRVSMPAFLDMDSSAYAIYARYPRERGSLSAVTAQLGVPGSRPLLIAAAAVIVVALGLAALVVFQLRRLLTAVVAGRPFATESARRVRLIGAAVLAAELLRAAVLFGASWWAHGHLHADGVRFREVFPVRLEVILLGVLLVLLGQVFDLGARLQQDHDLTI